MHAIFLNSYYKPNAKLIRRTNTTPGPARCPSRAMPKFSALTPDHVHVMMQGRIVKSGGKELAQRLEAEGYKGIVEELGLDIEIDE